MSTWESDVSLDLALDWRVLGFTAALACASAIVAGVAPVLGLRSVAAGEALKDAGRGLAGDRRFAVRGTLVVAQIAVSLMLVTAAGLFLRSFASLNQLPLGFVPEPLLIAELDLQSSDAPIEQRGPRAERLRAAAAAVPGVRSASLSRVSLLTGGGWGANRIAIDDGPMPVEDRSAQPALAQCHNARAGSTPWGRRSSRGRDFTDDDRAGAPLVAIVNQAFVRRYQLGQQPIGRTVRIGVSNGETRYEIVGLVGDSVYTSPRDGMMATMFVPLAQLEPEALGETVVLTINVDRGQRAAVAARCCCRTRADRADRCVHLQDVRSVHRRDRDAGAPHRDALELLRRTRSPVGRHRALRHRRPSRAHAPERDRSSAGARCAASGDRASRVSAGWNPDRGRSSRSDWQAASGRRSSWGRYCFTWRPAIRRRSRARLVCSWPRVCWPPGCRRVAPPGSIPRPCCAKGKHAG